MKVEKIWAELQAAVWGSTGLKQDFIMSQKDNGYS